MNFLRMKKHESHAGWIRQNQDLVFAGIIVLLGLVLRLVHLGTNHLSLDEPFSVFHAQRSIPGIAENLKGLNNPPLNEIILHFWIRLFGISPAVVRIPSLIFGVLNILVLYLLARRFFNTRVAVLSSLLVCFSSYHLYFSQEARVYALFALLTSCSFYLFFRLVKNDAKIVHLVLLYLTFILLVFSHYFAVAVILLQAGFLIFTREDRGKIILRFSMIVLGVLLTYSFYLPEIYARFIESSQNGTWLKPVKSLGNLYDLIYVFANRNRLLYLLTILALWGGAFVFVLRSETNKYLRFVLLYGLIPLYFLVSYSIFFRIPFIWKLTSLKPFIFSFLSSILLVYVGMFFRYGRRFSIQFITAGWFLVPLILFFGVSFFIPVFLDRYLVFIFPAFCLTLAMSVSGIFPSRLFYPAAALLVFIMILTFNLHESNKRDAIGMVKAVRERREAGIKVYICPDQFKYNFAYYYNRNLFTDFQNFEDRMDAEHIYFVYSRTDIDDLRSPADSGAIFVDARGSFLFPGNGIAERLTELYGEGETLEFQDSMYVHIF